MVSYYFLNKRIDYDDYDLTLYHSHMFHGTADRIGAEYPLLSYRYGDELKYRIHITKNVFNISDVFQPVSNLVVSLNVRNKLVSVLNCTFLKVEYKKIFFEEYSNNHYPDIDNEELFQRFVHNPKLLKSISDYYELIVPRLTDELKDEYYHKKTVTIESEVSSFNINLSKSIKDKFPIFWYNGNFIRKDYYNKIERFIEADYYEIIPVEL